MQLEMLQHVISCQRDWPSPRHCTDLHTLHGDCLAFSHLPGSIVAKRARSPRSEWTVGQPCTLRWRALREQVQCDGSHQEFTRGWFYKRVMPFLNNTVGGTVPRPVHNEL